MKVAVTGATGFIGPRLISRLQGEGHSVRVLGRRDPRIDGTQFAPWDSAAVEPPASALSDADAVVHLAGEPVSQRWNEHVKQRIRDSRVFGTRNLVSAIGKLNTRPSILVSASAIGYYGDRGDQVLTEPDAPGWGFLPEVCVEWEREARNAGSLGLRVTMLRIGIVLGAGGGALAQMVPPFRFGAGGPVGSGQQWVSWIHLDDLVDLVLFALGNEEVFGPVNATAPEPVRNVDFAHTLGHVLHRPSLVHTPALAIKVMFGEMAGVVLASQRVIPQAASRAGFEFQYPELRGALAEILT